MALPIEVIAALWGAGAGAGGSLLMEAGRWFLYRRKRAESIRVALYYEIFRHGIFEGHPSPDGQPSFLLTAFGRAAYDAYLGEMPDLLTQELFGAISIYYANVTLASSLQERMEEDIRRARSVTGDLLAMTRNREVGDPADPDRIGLLGQEEQQTRDRLADTIQQLRLLLAAAMAQREELLAVLRARFRRDPAQEPVVVLPKHREWFDHATSTRLRRGGDV